jgi:hypothetical protein
LQHYIRREPGIAGKHHDPSIHRRAVSPAAQDSISMCQVVKRSGLTALVQQHASSTTVGSSYGLDTCTTQGHQLPPFRRASSLTAKNLCWATPHCIKKDAATATCIHTLQFELTAATDPATRQRAPENRKLMICCTRPRSQRRQVVHHMCHHCSHSTRRQAARRSRKGLHGTQSLRIVAQLSIYPCTLEPLCSNPCQAL